MGALFISLEVRALGRLGMSIGLRLGPGGAGDWVFAFWGHMYLEFVEAVQYV